MIPSLLVLCAPNLTEKPYYFLAPERIAADLRDLGWRVVFETLDPRLPEKPMLESKIALKRFTPFGEDEYTLVWTMFPDPFKQEVKAALLALGFYTKSINRKLDAHYKANYLRTLARNKVGPEVRPDLDWKTLSWRESKWGAARSVCGRYVRVFHCNNNRAALGQSLVVEYLDSAVNGRRSFVRAGYAGGRITAGWLYSHDVSSDILKTGMCESREPHLIDEKFHEALITSFKEMYVDVCQFEGVYVGDRFYVFDVNPFPTCSGKTLRVIAAHLALAINEKHA